MKQIKLTPKQEDFCHFYIEMGNASEAYRESYDADSMNENTVNRKAHDLLENGKITARLEQIRKEHQRRHNLTVDTLLAELEDARKAAFIGDKAQVAGAVAATMGKAKLLGLDKQILVHSNDPENPITDTKASAKKLSAIAKLKKAKQSNASD